MAGGAGIEHGNGEQQPLGSGVSGSARFMQERNGLDGVQFGGGRGDTRFSRREEEGDGVTRFGERKSRRYVILNYLFNFTFGVTTFGASC
ncbi:hypothetical protein FNV43_RR00524 [Rhamnella rubrinervis]|uniref:Uncharacterized protein n=1 Tax=Rhamnella rubrinervis TaxID=2594499 RepID=A0A8K0HN17_9ROSA|nr:hypothetical protein FNV43_RR00524 [Rhamnella rubrinervis]